MLRRLGLLYLYLSIVAIVASGCAVGELELDPNNDYTLDWSDGDVIDIKSATKGGDLNGFNIIIMGDGFTEAQMENDGVYEQIIRQAAEHILDIEPMKSYAEYVNIYGVVVVSDKSGVSAESEDDADTTLGCYYGEGTEVCGNHTAVQQYLYKVTNLGSTERQRAVVCVVLNDDKHAGTTYFFSNMDFAIAYCPYDSYDNTLFGQLVHHEVVGHGVGRLLDEYIYYYTTIDSDTLTELTGYLASGIGANISTDSNPTTVSWSSFIGLEGYEEVGIYNGAYFYSSGVYRPESKSCMDDNRAYFNAPSRRAIVERVLSDAGATFDYDDFIENDMATQPVTIPTPVYSFGSRSGTEHQHLHPPKMVMESPL